MLLKPFKDQLKKTYEWYPAVAAAVGPLRTAYSLLHGVASVNIGFWHAMLNVFYMTFMSVAGCMAGAFFFFFIALASLSGFLLLFAVAMWLLSMGYLKYFDAPFTIMERIPMGIMMWALSLVSGFFGLAVASGAIFDHGNPLAHQLFRGATGWIETAVGGCFFCIAYAVLYLRVRRWWRASEVPQAAAEEAH
jgi:hypothetical protein